MACGDISFKSRYRHKFIAESKNVSNIELSINGKRVSKAKCVVLFDIR
jgi:hypothetical protein